MKALSSFFNFGLLLSSVGFSACQREAESQASAAGGPRLKITPASFSQSDDVLKLTSHLGWFVESFILEYEGAGEKQGKEVRLNVSVERWSDGTVTSKETLLCSNFDLPFKRELSLSLQDQDRASPGAPYLLACSLRRLSPQGHEVVSSSKRLDGLKVDGLSGPTSEAVQQPLSLGPSGEASIWGCFLWRSSIQFWNTATKVEDAARRVPACVVVKVGFSEKT